MRIQGISRQGEARQGMEGVLAATNPPTHPDTNTNTINSKVRDRDMSHNSSEYEIQEEIKTKNGESSLTNLKIHVIIVKKKSLTS